MYSTPNELFTCSHVHIFMRTYGDVSLPLTRQNEKVPKFSGGLAAIADIEIKCLRGNQCVRKVPKLIEYF
jgi:hypothetical protein